MDHVSLFFFNSSLVLALSYLIEFVCMNDATLRRKSRIHLMVEQNVGDYCLVSIGNRLDFARLFRFMPITFRRNCTKGYELECVCENSDIIRPCSLANRRIKNDIIPISIFFFFILLFSISLFFSHRKWYCDWLFGNAIFPR